MTGSVWSISAGMLLILGGTAEAKTLANALYRQGLDISYSIAGLVRQPDLPCKVISGGFSQYGGLAEYLRKNKIDAVLDITHPFAEKISKAAQSAARQNDIPYWRFVRPEWQALEDDQWRLFSDLKKLQATLQHYQSIFFTIGQLDESWLQKLEQINSHILVRTAVPPKHPLPSNFQWIQGIPPFALADEIALMQQHTIDCLVSKNSGGDKTYAKLEAARKLGIEVLMLERPGLPQADVEFNEPDACKSFIISALSRKKCHKS